jgi:hypothetical protein
MGPHIVGRFVFATFLGWDVLSRIILQEHHMSDDKKLTVTFILSLLILPLLLSFRIIFWTV